MKNLLLYLTLNVLIMSTLNAQNIYDFTVKNRKGDDVQISEYKGKVLLIVNTATRCGFTPQYTELQNLYDKYADKGFEILDFPCNQFGEQAPGSNEEIHDFCTLNYSIKFPQLGKLNVNGDNEHPLFTFLKKQKPFEGFDLNHPIGKILEDMLRKQDPDYDKNPSIKWNFTKFLIAKDGTVVRRYEPTQDIADVEKDIIQEINK